ncbi:response regulator [Ectothiorhodospiraceae bacterium 2226]|nr:response regulator [Ectothiorhodospiraceae bacterium 2226]
MSEAAVSVLLADDDRLILTTLGQGLERAGFEVLRAPSGEEAVRLAELRRPDIALLDVRMPGIGGIEAARQLGRAGIPVLFLSAYDDADTVREAVDEGAVGYLVKPVDVPKIVPSLRAALSVSEQLRRLRAEGEHLAVALASGRAVSVAVGLIMERYRLTQAGAFEALRAHARSQRRKVQEVAAELASASDALNLSPQALRRGGAGADA